ncbi:2142_t:CDS:2 [Diversispora eburnea]|uniref:2142_t:CDS:1 n=1 Tax=Diversispora eburnea TaxID=1213867 RepID=A0A9N8YWL7_9GLOM|nr:2142_t:CDS:2 [Diversispora eburnea]
MNQKIKASISIAQQLNKGKHQKIKSSLDEDIQVQSQHENGSKEMGFEYKKFTKGVYVEGRYY